ADAGPTVVRNDDGPGESSGPSLRAVGSVGFAVGAGLGATLLDELLEPLEVTLDALVDHVGDVTQLLDEALGVVVEVKRDLRAAAGSRAEGHLAVIADVADGT